ncbi:prepilin peptidase [Pseudodesulfovibrio sp.]|uniref:preprotein translocase subunit SecA n=1 Tax=Pseudodesulfovibrio sp. TaxID=2035812 RepID=UPI0026096A3C|nr:prepilin peptidase [Pseudodesulfovibrio sp.]MDD3311117.1 prepilin peptidase [Pseudodesulfovibrio sp.]
MGFADGYLFDQVFAGRDRPRFIPLGWDWLVARTELFFAPRPETARLLEQAGAVLALEAETAALSGRELTAGLEEMRAVFRLGREGEDDLLRAMALVRETAWRTRRELPYLPQVAGALGILQHCIVEMATGEGKTLTAALAAAVAGWRGKGCHVVTSNDYLAARDAETMTGFYAACLVSCGSVSQDSTPDERRAAYAKDVTYLTSKEATADFLRDQMALGTVRTHARVLARALAGGEVPVLVQRGLSCAIVDEADSVLCDGGSTPLIISVPKDNAPSAEQYLAASALAETLRIGVHYRVNRRFREASLTDAGRRKVAESLKGPRPWARRNRAVELALQAVEAREFFQASVQYVVRDGKVVIVDEATGRTMPDHEWRDGLHQAVSAKEGVEVVPPRATSAQTTFQDFFLRYRSLGGMTGTAWEARGEFLQFFRLAVVRIPTHRPCIRRVCYRAFHVTNDEKIRDIVANVAQEHEKGRAVLVGTKSISASEQVSKALRQAGIFHEVLNAVQHGREAEIVALAGREGAVTVATNMAGRGTDIKLDDRVRESGGLHVILTELHGSVRVDRQLHGRAGRQGDPGSVAEIIGLEDDLFATLPRWARRALTALLRTGRAERQARRAAWIVARLLQRLGDYKAFRMRRRMVRSKRQFADMISYSGGER